MSVLPTKRQPECYQNIKNTNPRKKYELISCDRLPESVRVSISARPESGFRNKVITVQPDKDQLQNRNHLQLQMNELKRQMNTFKWKMAENKDELSAIKCSKKPVCQFIIKGYLHPGHTHLRLFQNVNSCGNGTDYKSDINSMTQSLTR